MAARRGVMSAPGYPLGYSEDEARRLALQAALFEDLTADVLRRAGIGPGMQILDLGCGVGDVSLLAASMVGTSGTVLGIDRNTSSTDTARRRAATLDLSNIRFETAELDQFDTVETFDALIGRFVLLYLPDPAATLRRFQKFLRPSGIVAFQEMDMKEVSQVPASEVFERTRSWLLTAFKLGGVELNMGGRMPSLFMKAGLPRPAMIAASRVESGSDSTAYEYMAQTLRSVLPALERAGITTADEVGADTLADRLRREAAAKDSVTFLPRLVGACCRLQRS